MADSSAPETDAQSDFELLKDTMKQNDMKTLDLILESLDGYDCSNTYSPSFKMRKKKVQKPNEDQTLVPTAPTPLVVSNPPTRPADPPIPPSLTPAPSPAPSREPPPLPPLPPQSVASLFTNSEPLQRQPEKGLQRNNSSDFSMRCLSSLTSRFSFFFNPSSAASKSSPSLPTKPPLPPPAPAPAPSSRAPVQRAKSVPLFATHAPAKPATRESVAHSVWLLAQSARSRCEVTIAVTIALRDISAQLFAISDAISAVPDTAFEEALLAKQLSKLATRCAMFDTRMAADIWLIVADYTEFVLGCPVDAANALERAVYYIDSTDVRRIVGLLRESGKLYEKGTQFDHALRIERKLEPFDLSVDWISQSRARQQELASKLLPK